MGQLAGECCDAADAPNYKQQMTNKFQYQNSKLKEASFGHLQLKFGIYLEFVIWNFSPARAGFGSSRRRMRGL